MIRYTKKITVYNLDPIPTGIKIYWRINNSNYDEENKKHLPYCIYLFFLYINSLIVPLKGGKTRRSLRKLWKWAIYIVLEQILEERKENNERKQALIKSVKQSSRKAQSADDDTETKDLIKTLYNEGDIASKNINDIIQKYKSQSENKYRRLKKKAMNTTPVIETDVYFIICLI